MGLTDIPAISGVKNRPSDIRENATGFFSQRERTLAARRISLPDRLSATYRHSRGLWRLLPQIKRPRQLLGAMTAAAAHGSPRTMLAGGRDQDPLTIAKSRKAMGTAATASTTKSSSPASRDGWSETAIAAANARATSSPRSRRGCSAMGRRFGRRHGTRARKAPGRAGSPARPSQSAGRPY